MQEVEAPSLKGLFYAQFDDVVGPQFLHIVPEGILSDTLLKHIVVYVFPKLELCDSLLTIRGLGKLKIVSYPMFIESAKYNRHRFVFSFGMVFKQDDDIGPYRPVLKKIASFFHRLEEDSQYLSDTGKDMIGPLLSRIMEDLVARGECILRVQAGSSLSLKLCPRLLDPPLVGDFQVPVLIKKLKHLMLKDWDLTIQNLAQFIDGKKFVKRIALESGMDIQLVKNSLRQLLYYRVIVMLDAFQYSNLYTCTKKISNLASNELLQDECLKQVIRGGEHAARQVPFSKVFALYASMHPSASFGDFCIEHSTELMSLDEQMFVSFGLRTGILRRVLQFPVPTAHPFLLQDSEPKGTYLVDTQSETVRSLINGENSFDDICGITTFSHAEVQLVIDAMPDVSIVKI